MNVLVSEVIVFCDPRGNYWTVCIIYGHWHFYWRSMIRSVFNIRNILTDEIRPYTGGTYKIDNLLGCTWVLKRCESCTSHVLVPCMWVCFRYIATFVQLKQNDWSVNSTQKKRCAKGNIIAGQYLLQSLKTSQQKNQIHLNEVSQLCLCIICSLHVGLTLKVKTEKH